MRETVTLEIAGAKYRMTSDTDSAHLHRLAAIVNNRIDAMGPRAKRAGSPAQLLAVVALGLAEDLQVAELRRQRLKKTTRDVVSAAMQRIDDRLRTDAEVRASERPDTTLPGGVQAAAPLSGEPFPSADD